MKLREYCEQKLEALGVTPRIELELDDGSSITLEHPSLWDDKTQAAVNKAASSADIVKAILGVADHKRFVAAGGSSNQVLLAVEMMKRKSDDEMKPDPKGD